VSELRASALTDKHSKLCNGKSRWPQRRTTNDDDGVGNVDHDDGSVGHDDGIVGHGGADGGGGTTTMATMEMTAMTVRRVRTGVTHSANFRGHTASTMKSATLTINPTPRTMK